jgi:hypothetical protein
VDRAAAAFGVANGTLANKVSCDLLGRGFGMALFAPVSRYRVWKWKRAYTIVLGTTAMTSLATGCIRVMWRAKIIFKKGIACCWVKCG